MKTFNSVGYLAPEFEVTDVMTERGFAEGRLGILRRLGSATFAR